MINNDEEYKVKVINDRKTVNLNEFMQVLLGKILYVIVAGIILAVIAFGVSKFFITPKYESETKVYVLNSSNNSNNESTITTGDLQAGSYLTKDYMELVKSRPVLEHTIKKLNLDITTDKLKSMIDLNTPADTRILCIKVTHSDPEMARNIANTVREAAGKQICSIMNVDAVNVIEKADLPLKPASPNILINTLAAGMLGIVLAIIFIFVKFISDDTIKNTEDVERYLGLITLTTVPEISKKTRKTIKNKKKTDIRQSSVSIGKMVTDITKEDDDVMQQTEKNIEEAIQNSELDSNIKDKNNI